MKTNIEISEILLTSAAEHTGKSTERAAHLATAFVRNRLGNRNHLAFELTWILGNCAAVGPQNGLTQKQFNALTSVYTHALELIQAP